MKNDSFDKAYMKNILYFASKYLKRALKIKSYKIGPFTYFPGTKYLLNTLIRIKIGQEVFSYKEILKITACSENTNQKSQQRKVNINC